MSIKVVQELYQAFGRGDVAAILERLADDVEWEHDWAAAHGIPWIQPRRGRADVGGFFAALARLDFQRFELVNLLEGGNQVVGVFQVAHRDRETGKDFRDLELHLWTFDQADRVVRFRHVLDTHQMWLQGQRP